MEIWFRLRRPGGAVNQRDAVEQKAGGERAHEKIFHRRFAGAAAGAPHAGEHGKSRSTWSPSQGKNYQIVGRRHENHADSGEEHQRIKFALVDRLSA